jgi:hypothetical protein
VVINSIPVDQADFAIEVKAERIGRLPGINVILELIVPRSKLERERERTKGAGSYIS